MLYSNHEPNGNLDDLACDADSVTRMQSVMTQILAMETAKVREPLSAYFNFDVLINQGVALSMTWLACAALCIRCVLA